MNTFYDKGAASSRLDKRLAESPKDGEEADIMPLNDIQLCSYEIYAVSEPPSYRLKDKGPQEPEEVTFRVRGIICQHRLPPIYTTKNTNTLPFMRQTVQLVSLNATLAFEKYFTVINDIFTIFQSSVPGKVHPPGTQIYEGHRCVVLSNPYFSRRNLMPNMESLPLGDMVDPTGYLTRNQPQQFHHTMDNQVTYLKEVVMGDKVRFMAISPTQFENGDIVEAQFSFVAFPMYKNKDEYQLKMCLRTVIMLDDTFRRQSMSTNVTTEHHIPVYTLKRKVTYVMNDSDCMDIDAKEAKRTRGKEH